jgi:hypothetical protein
MIIFTGHPAAALTTAAISDATAFVALLLQGDDPQDHIHFCRPQTDRLFRLGGLDPRPVGPEGEAHDGADKRRLALEQGSGILDVDGIHAYRFELMFDSLPAERFQFLARSLGPQQGVVDYSGVLFPRELHFNLIFQCVCLSV